MSLAAVPIGIHAPERVNAIVEIPKGSNFKYEYDPTLDVIRLDRVLYSPLFYPVDYGFIPQTCADDGDPLDVLIWVTGASFPGCVMEVRPLSLLNMRDEKGPDYKVLAVPSHEPRYQEVNRMEDLGAHIPREIQHFFEVYKALEEKAVEVLGWDDQAAALAVIRRTMAAYQRSR